jgi:hypothetical protein
MAERPCGKKLMANELVLQKLRETFEQNENITTNSNGTNVWVMLVATKSIAELQKESLPYAVQTQVPTHQVRVVLRTSDAQTGPNPYVDGTDLFLAINEQQQTAEFVWEDETLGDAPLFHGGEVTSSLAWTRKLVEPFYIQFNDPFLP